MLRSTFMTGLLGLTLVVTACSSPAAELCARRDECLQEENIPGDNDDSDDGDDDVYRPTPIVRPGAMIVSTPPLK